MSCASRYAASKNITAMLRHCAAGGWPGRFHGEGRSFALRGSATRLGATLECEGRMIESLDTRIRAHALALGLLLISKHRALRTIKGMNRGLHGVGHKQKAGPMPAVGMRWREVSCP